MPLLAIALLVAPLSIPLLSLPATAEPELWACKRSDGSIMFTDKIPNVTGCSQYRLRTELGFLSRKTAEEKPEAPKPASEPKAPPSAQPITINIIVSAPPPTPPPPRIEAQPPLGEIPFEVFRMLSVGMTEGEILGRAGLPQTTLIGGSYAFGSPYPIWPIFGANRFVYSSGDWIVELEFTGGRVASINQTRLRP